MKIDLLPATENDRETVQNLGRFYVYDMSKYCGFLPGWETPKNGLFECLDLSDYWTEPNRYPFLIKVDQEIAGFALINKIGTTPDVDWNMGQFFIISKFQGKGIGTDVAQQLFHQFLGIWEVTQIPENKGAIAFWEKVIGQHSNGAFERTQKIIPHPEPHPKVVMKFRSPPLYSQASYTLHYEEQASSEDEAILFEGLCQDAFQKKGMRKMQPFAFFMRDSKKRVLAGIKGITYYGCLYTASLWVAAEFRHQGWGSKLMIEAEQLGIMRKCTFATVTTMDWEALPFYQKLGYQIEYVREGYENASRQFLLRKSLMHVEKLKPISLQLSNSTF